MKLRESQLLKNQKALTGTKRDGRRKFIKSTTPQSDLKRPVVRKQQGGIFTTYNSITPYEGPTFELPSIAIEPEPLPINKLEANRRKVVEQIEKLESNPEVTEEPSKEPFPVSKETEETKETSVKLPETGIKTKEDFVKTMTPAFENALKSKGLDTKYAKYLVAQSALESNWGKSQSGKFNFGGIKGKGTTRKTREVVNGKDVYINDSFRDFKDINDYANYHVSLLNNKRYQAFNGDFIDSVVRGGYATDPNYKNALTNVYNQIAKGQKGLIVQAVNKVKSILPKEEPKEPVNTVEVIKEYGPSLATSFLTGNINPFVSKLLKKNKEPEVREVKPLDYESTFRYIRNLENPDDKGINYETGIVKNYDNNTAGWGTDYTYGAHRDLKPRILAGKWTVQEAKDIAVEDMRASDNRIMKKMKQYTNRPDTISEGPRLLMAQAAYHYGNINKSLKQWGPAVATGDAKKQKELALKLAVGRKGTHESPEYKDRYNKIKEINIYE